MANITISGFDPKWVSALYFHLFVHGGSLMIVSVNCTRRRWGSDDVNAVTEKTVVSVWKKAHGYLFSLRRTFVLIKPHNLAPQLSLCALA